VTYSYWLEGRDGDWSAWTPATHVFYTGLAPGNYTFRVKAQDPAGNISPIEIRTFEILESSAPVMDHIGNKVIGEGNTLNFLATATDPDLGQTLTFSLDTGAPAGAGIAPTTGAFSWTPTEAQGPGTYTVTVRVTDSGSPALSDSETITITVNEVNVAPTLDSIGDKTVNEGSTLNFTATVSDADLPSQALSFSLNPGAPPGATIDPTTGAFSWTPTEAQGPGTYTVTIRVTDDGSPAQSASETITIVVYEVNVAPAIAPIPDKFVQEGSLLTFPVVASDPDLPPQQLAFSLGSGTPSGASIDPVTGVFSWTPPAGHSPMTNEITVFVLDDGTPVLGAQRTFRAIVTGAPAGPTILSITVNGQVRLSWSSIPGHHYQIQSSTDLISWTDLGSEIMANDVTTSRSHATGPEQQVFYRVSLTD
jgi:PKD repeat protein